MLTLIYDPEYSNNKRPFKLHKMDEDTSYLSIKIEHNEIVKSAKLFPGDDADITHIKTYSDKYFKIKSKLLIEKINALNKEPHKVAIDYELINEENILNDINKWNPS